MCDRLVAAYVEADREQESAVRLVAVMAERKREAVQAMRESGLTYKQIGSLVGLSVSGVQRVARKGSAV